MKKLLVVASSALLVVITACSTTTFTEYRGQSLVQGKGGTIRTVEGIDFWENGDPDRNYRILGVIDDARREAVFAPRADRAVAKLAKEHGADGVIMVGQGREYQGIDLNTGAARFNRVTKILAIKYER